MPGLLKFPTWGHRTIPSPGVGRYLREFLSDPRVLDISAVGRWALLNPFILPTRPKKSAAAYAKVVDRAWLSLLVTYSLGLKDAMQAKLERMRSGWSSLGMRYGRALARRRAQTLLGAACDRIVPAPLYPQYASASTGSSVEELYRLVARALVVTPSIRTLASFYDDAGFLYELCRGRSPGDRSGAGPVRPRALQLPRPARAPGDEEDDTGQHCLKSASCCDEIVAANRNCYRAQCYATTRALVSALGLSIPHTVSFQSRLGRTPWIKPYTDVVMPELAKQGVRRLVVFCPAFVADCLETLEEIGIRAKQDWAALGGEALTLVPSLNATPAWVDALVTLVRKEIP